ncbi:uncharacterized protein K444DRAFT_619073 [Hyaloscypha bicolor E]|uniref:Uncharacterized protein n=1 Tax=Hyaloscypha bicolor E TaxID=1095630 RepID=A0A2J6SS26_9HELO|nr:uncharacterized protein K444DRAFT_619073 [Hyaloscypha bicolor E]PMD53539.1 hypothetical protein K444DRAFT_619073 [Hyaloscypha bicolor E]
MSSLHTLKLMGQWAIALTVSRILQAILTIAALAVDGAVISAWNADQYKFNSYFSEGAKANWSLDTTVGGTPFTGVVIAAVRDCPIFCDSKCEKEIMEAKSRQS